MIQAGEFVKILFWLLFRKGGYAIRVSLLQYTIRNLVQNTEVVPFALKQTARCCCRFFRIQR